MVGGIERGGHCGKPDDASTAANAVSKERSEARDRSAWGLSTPCWPPNLRSQPYPNAIHHEALVLLQFGVAERVVQIVADVFAHLAVTGRRDDAVLLHRRAVTEE